MLTGKTRLNLRPATRADIRAVEGMNPPMSVRAWAVDYHGEVAAVGGYGMTSMGMLAFSKIIKPMPKVAIYRLMKEAMARMPKNLVCQADPGSGPFLEKLGWVPAEQEGVYLWRH